MKLTTILAAAAIGFASFVGVAHADDLSDIIGKNQESVSKLNMGTLDIVTFKGPMLDLLISYIAAENDIDVETAKAAFPDVDTIVLMNASGADNSAFYAFKNGKLISGKVITQERFETLKKIQTNSSL